LTFTNGHTGRTFHKWVLKHGAEDQLMDKISKISISFDRSEYSTVPDNDPITIEVEPSQGFRDWQRLVAENSIVNVNGIEEDCSDPSVKGEKFLQLSAGFLYYNKKSVYKLKENPKLDKLIQLINESEGKVIIWHKHTPEAHIIEDALAANGIGFMSIRGETKEDKTLVAKDFAANEVRKVLLVQQSINEGWSGLAAKTMIFYTPVAGSRRRNQCIGRMMEEGQDPNYKIYDLLVKDSFDITVKGNLKKNVSFARSAMDYIKSFNR
jgi:SNF2 family DNA or RNA helicase